MSDDPIPAVSEADARGDVHRLFEDIRQVLGVPVVNLIFRHLATLPGCLGWSWGVLRPLHASGQVADAADRLGTSLPLPPVGPGARESLRRDGVDAGGERAIGRILDSYNRSNAMNLVALTGLLDWLRSASGQALAGADPRRVLPHETRRAASAFPRCSLWRTWTRARGRSSSSSTRSGSEATDTCWLPCTGISPTGLATSGWRPAYCGRSTRTVRSSVWPTTRCAAHGARPDGSDPGWPPGTCPRP